MFYPNLTVQLERHMFIEKEENIKYYVYSFLTLHKFMVHSILQITSASGFSFGVPSSSLQLVWSRSYIVLMCVGCPRRKHKYCRRL
jgi:hypothetical protein